MGSSYLSLSPFLYLSFLLLFFFFFTGRKSVLCDELRIHNARELIELSDNVNNGKNYSGTTVLLDSDIVFTDELSQIFEPIGNDTEMDYFLGTFDGQGHTISNLKINKTSLQYGGLFGHSKGCTLRNIVIDRSCSVTSYVILYRQYVSLGGIIGDCQSDNGPCRIENSLNMGNITFKGNVSDRALYIAGIAGIIDFEYHEGIIKNCVNYGLVINSGTSIWGKFGGIVGYTQKVPIQNCFNYGAVINNDTEIGLQFTGGIVGQSEGSYIDNCVNTGEVTTNHPEYHIGIIDGYTIDTEISHCYWDQGITEDLYGLCPSPLFLGCSSFNSETLELNESVSVGAYTGTSLLSALNAGAEYYYLRDYSRWVFNGNENSVSFAINGFKSSLVLNSKIILLPNLANEGNTWFDGWYTDALCRAPLMSFEITEDTELHGKWEANTNSYTISFDSRGGTPIPEPITGTYLSVVSLPNNTEKRNCTVGFWANEYGDVMAWKFTVPAHNLTLHAVWRCTHINNAADLVDFSKVVNNMISDFYGTTVFLDSDIVFTDELTQKFEPIGKRGSNSFEGTFDGQGHTISNLVISSKTEHIGLFGYSWGSTIRNVVIDSSCLVVNPQLPMYSDIHIGGIIGEYSYSGSDQYIIENIVNMADIIVSGDAYVSYPYTGGIVGTLSSHGEVALMNCVNYGSILFTLPSSYSLVGGVVGYLSSSVTIVSCANYGSILFTGTRSDAYLGGVVGRSRGESGETNYIQNSLNHGSIVYNGTTNPYIYVGGITGWCSYTTIENCMSAGKITLNNSTNKPYAGFIIGYIDSTEIKIKNTHWTSDMEEDYKMIGMGSLEVSYGSTTVMDKDSLSKMNSYTCPNEWSKWTMLHPNGGRINNFNRDPPIIGLFKILPVFTKEGYTFMFWCIDANCTYQYFPHKTYHDSLTNIYAHWAPNNYTVSFDGNGGIPSKQSMEITFDEEYGELPEARMTGYALIGWFTEAVDGEEVTNETIFKLLDNQTLYAHWVICNYTATFDFGNGTEISEEFTFNDTIEYPEDIEREGYTFSKWEPQPERMGAEDITIKAQWNITTEYVKVVFGNTALRKEDVRKIIAGYVQDGEEFSIVEFDVDKSAGEVTVIIRFRDKDGAYNFIESVTENKKPGDEINSLKPAVDYIESFAVAVLPTALCTISSIVLWILESI